MVLAGMRLGTGGGEKNYLLQKGVINLFCGVDFYCFHHFAGGDDGAAEGLGRGGHGGGEKDVAVCVKVNVEVPWPSMRGT